MAKLMHSPSDSLILLHERISSHLEQISKLFTQRPRITIIIRTPWLEKEGKDGGVLIGDDDFDLAIQEIERLRGRKPTVEGENVK